MDTVEIVMGLEEAFGIKIPDKEAERLFTTADVIDYICCKNGAGGGSAADCLTARAFYRLRRVMVRAGVPRSAVCPGAQIRHLFPGREGKTRWEELGVGPRYGTFLGVPINPTTVEMAARWLAFEDAREMVKSGRRLSRGEVRMIVRNIVAENLGLTDFADDDKFVEDLGAD